MPRKYEKLRLRKKGGSYEIRYAAYCGWNVDDNMNAAKVIKCEYCKKKEGEKGGTCLTL